MLVKFVVWNIGGNIFEQISNIFCQTIRGTVQNLFTNFLRRGGRSPIEFSFSVSFIMIILVLVIPFLEREVLNLINTANITKPFGVYFPVRLFPRTMSSNTIPRDGIF